MYDIEQRKRQWRRFLSPQESAGHVFLIAHNPNAPERPLPWPQLTAQRIEWAWDSYQRAMDRLRWLRDDTIPCLDVYTGTEIFAEAFGCPVERPGDTMPFARPLIHSASEVASLKVPEVSSSSLAMLFEIADELRRRAGPDALVKLVDIQGPMDIACLIWDKNDLFLALLESPEAVKELAAKVQQLLTAFLDAWFTRYGREFIAHYPSYYMPQGLTLSEDEVGIISPEMFREFFLPELTSLSQRYGGIGMHCCADSMHQWENFKRVPGLRLLNLVRPNEQLRKAYDYFAPHVAQWHNWSGDEPAWERPGRMPRGSRIVIEAAANTRQEATEMSDQLWAACGRE